MRNSHVGAPMPRIEAAAKVSGTARYVDDINLPEMLYGLTIRSSVSKGKINGIKFDQNFDWSGFTIVLAKDIPGDNVVALITDDQPYLASDYINHSEEPVVLIAHADKHRLERARNRVTVDILLEKPCYTINDALVLAETKPDVLQKEFLVEKGNASEASPAWKAAYKITEGEYQTGAQEHLYIEPNGIIATANPLDGVTVIGSLQCPYYVHKALKRLFGMADDKIRVIQAETGGGFGGKEEYPSMIAGHAALLAWKSGKPVKLIYDRAEDMIATTKRHPSKTKIRSAVDKSGRLLALDIDFTLDGGGYTTLSPVVLSRGTLHAAGAYDCPNTRIRSRSVQTNNPPNGAFRGFGAPQSIFAIEQHMNAIARELGLCETELRRRNFLKDHSLTTTGQVIQDHVDLGKLLDRAKELSNFDAKRREFEKSNLNSPIKRGIGLASFMHGAGFTGSGERNMASVVGICGTSDGKVRVLAASTEIGQGTSTVFTQIACDALGLSPDMIEIATPDTKFVPNSGPTVASRTTMVVGKLVQDCCEALLKKLRDENALKPGHSPEELSETIKSWINKNGDLRVYCQYQQPPHINWDDKTYQGEFRMSNMEGRGVEIWVDGRRYEGDFKNGKKDGEGTFEWPNGNKYVGSWRNGKQHGIGVWVSSEEGATTKRQGEWVNGKR